MMTRAKKLLPVAEMAHQATEHELHKLGQINASLQQDQDQLNDLIQYRAEYLNLFRQPNNMSSAKKALEMRAFLVQLDQAIQAQQQQVEISQRKVVSQQKVWVETRNKERAIETLMQKYDADEALREMRREQKEMDEHTTSMWVRRK